MFGRYAKAQGMISSLEYNMTVANKPSANSRQVVKAKEHNIFVNKYMLLGSIDHWA